MKFCGNCGTELKDDMKFCAKCGTPCGDRPAQKPARKIKRKRKPVIIGIASILVVALLAGAVMIMKNVLVPNETIYLRTSQTQINQDGDVIYYRWGYDEQGRLIGYEHGNEYAYSDMQDYRCSYHYEYDEDGNIEGAYLTTPGYSQELFSIYKNGRLMGYELTTGDATGTYQFEYDKKGNICAVDLVYSDGETKRVKEFSYDKDGNIREKTSYYAAGMIAITKYDESGRTCEQSQKFDGGYLYRYFSEYNEHGHMCGYKLYQGDKDELTNILEVDYTYDKEGRVTEIALKEDGEYARGVFEGSDTYRTLSFEGSSSSYGDMTITLEYDDAGNLISQSLYVDGELQSQTQLTYIPYELPRDYKKPNTNDPIYLVE